MTRTRGGPTLARGAAKKRHLRAPWRESRVLENEARLGLEGREQRGAGVEDRARAEAVAGADIDDGAPGPAATLDAAETAAVRELVEERLEPPLDEAVDKNHVIGRALRVAAVERTGHRGDAGDAERSEAIPRRGRGGRARFEPDHGTAETREDRRRVAEAAGDIERLLTPLDLESLKQPSDDHGLQHEAALGAGNAVEHRRVLIQIGEALAPGRNEALPRHRLHRGQHRKVVHVEGAHLAIHHRAPRQREVLHASLSNAGSAK